MSRCLSAVFLLSEHQMLLKRTKLDLKAVTRGNLQKKWRHSRESKDAHVCLDTPQSNVRDITQASSQMLSASHDCFDPGKILSYKKKIQNSKMFCFRLTLRRSRELRVSVWSPLSTCEPFQSHLHTNTLIYSCESDHENTTVGKGLSTGIKSRSGFLIYGHLTMRTTLNLCDAAPS